MPNKDFQNGFTLGLSAKGKIGTPTQTKSVTITANGSSTVSPDTGYALSSVGVTVNVPNPSTGSLNITANGTYDVTEKASAVVNIPRDGAPILKCNIVQITQSDTPVVIPTDVICDSFSLITASVGVTIQ